MIWFTSDTHFYHDNIVKYCDRPDDHNELMWDNLHRFVGSEDTLVHMGDVAFIKKYEVDELVKELPGARKILLQGNHDKRSKIRKGPWDEVFPYRHVVRWEFEGRKFALTHRPEDFYGFAHIFLHGHIHNEGPPFYKKNHMFCFNLCVEQWDYRPISLDQILSLSGVNG